MWSLGWCALHGVRGSYPFRINVGCRRRMTASPIPVSTGVWWQESFNGRCCGACSQQLLSEGSCGPFSDPLKRQLLQGEKLFEVLDGSQRASGSVIGLHTSCDRYNHARSCPQSSLWHNYQLTIIQHTAID